MTTTAVTYTSITSISQLKEEALREA